jgi:hypothetical protein
MLKKLLGAAAIAAVACALGPAQAARVGIGCSGENLAKAEGTAETMPDSPGKFTAEREIAQAQDAMLNGKMSGCAMHLGRAMRAETMAQAPYEGTMAQAPYTGTPTRALHADTVTQAPAETTFQGSSQPQWGWQPIAGPR